MRILFFNSHCADRDKHFSLQKVLSSFKSLKAKKYKKSVSVYLFCPRCTLKKRKSINSVYKMLSLYNKYKGFTGCLSLLIRSYSYVNITFIMTGKDASKTSFFAPRLIALLIITHRGVSKISHPTK